MPRGEVGVVAAEIEAGGAGGLAGTPWVMDRPHMMSQT